MQIYIDWFIVWLIDWLIDWLIEGAGKTTTKIGLKSRFTGDPRVKFISEPVCDFESWNGHFPLQRMESDPITTQLHIQNSCYLHYQKNCLADVRPGTVIVADRWV